MEKIYKTLIVLTFLIALFFFGRHIILKYEVVEGLYENQSCFDNGFLIKDSCCETYNCSKTYRNVKKFYCGGETMFDKMYIGTCYIKERIKIN